MKPNEEEQDQDPIEDDQDVDQQEQDDTSDEDTSDSDDSGEENTVEYWKAQALKEKEEKENYKQGLLSKKGKRDLSADQKPPEKPDVSESKVASVLDKRNERIALDDVVDPKSDSYIPELVNDAQYNEIIGYLPRSLDKSSPQKIVKALKIATKLWKEERGITDTPKPKDKSNELAMMSEKTGSTPPSEQKEKRTILRKNKSIDDWY